MHVLLCYGCPCVRHLSWNTCLSVDQEVSLEVAQASKIWICRTIFRCTVRTHVVCGDCFPLNLHGGGDNYIHITTIDYNTWGRCGINMTFNFLFIIGDELKTEKKKTSNNVSLAMFDAYNTKQKCYHQICVHCTLVWKKCLKRCKNHMQTTQWKSYYEEGSIASTFLLLRISAMEVAHTRFEQMRWSGGSTQSFTTRSPSWIRPIAERTLHIMVERRLLQRKHHPYSRR